MLHNTQVGIGTEHASFPPLSDSVKVEDNIKMDLRKMGCENVICIHQSSECRPVMFLWTQ
jgi:hypothetical protein